MSNKKKLKRFAPKLKIKKGDKVVIIAGVSKGAEGEVLEVFPAKNRVIVENVNIRKKHTRPTEGSAGGIIEVPGTIHISNIMLKDPKTGEPTRVGRRKEGDKIVRYSKKTGETIK